MKIFLSYGHDEHTELAHYLRKKLEGRGHFVWIDESEIKHSNDWEIAIEQGIENSHWVLALMTPHAIRRPDGVCLDEISYARFRGKNIAPIMVQLVQPPLSISRLQWLDMQDWMHPITGEINEMWCQGKLESILAILEGKNKLGFEGEQSMLQDSLRPLAYGVEIDSRIRNFYGRKWVFEAFEQWLHGDFRSRLFWVKGEPGIGKSSIASMICHRYAEAVAFHFCRYNDADKADPARAIQSIAYQLSTQLHDYQNALVSCIANLKSNEKNVIVLFNRLILEPLHTISNPGKRMVIVIDALDEALVSGRNDLLHVIASEFDKLPSWLGVVLTSRPDPEIIQKLARYKPYILTNSDVRNREDAEGYLYQALSDLDDEIALRRAIPFIIQKSEGSFLHLHWVVEEIHMNRMSLAEVEKFPQGLSGVYTEYFNRQFEDREQYKKEIRPLLEIVAASREPLAISEASHILGWDDYDADEAIDALGSIFQTSEGFIRPFHRSVVEWMLDSRKAGKDYRVSEKKGHERIANCLWEQYQININRLSIYGLKYFIYHLHQAGRDYDVNTVIFDRGYMETLSNKFLLKADLFRRKENTERLQMPVVRLITEADIDALMDLQNVILNSLNYQDIFHPDSKEFYLAHCNEKGRIFGVFYAEVLVAYALLSFPGYDEDNIGRDLGLPEQELPLVAHAEMMCIHPEYRGHGYEILLKKEMHKSVQTLGFKHFCATVHPLNLPSISLLLVSGFTIYHLKSKYGGKLRYIFYYEKSCGHSSECVKSISMSNLCEQVEAFSSNLIGYKLGKKDGIYYLKFRLKRPTAW